MTEALGDQRRGGRPQLLRRLEVLGPCAGQLLGGADDPAMLPGDPEPGDDLAPQRVVGRERAEQFLAVLVVQDDEEIPLAREVPVERARREACVARDVGEPRSRVAVLGKRATSRLK